MYLTASIPCQAVSLGGWTGTPSLSSPCFHSRRASSGTSRTALLSCVLRESDQEWTGVHLAPNVAVLSAPLAPLVTVLLQPNWELFWVLGPVALHRTLGYPAWSDRGLGLATNVLLGSSTLIKATHIHSLWGTNLEANANRTLYLFTVICHPNPFHVPSVV